MNNPQKIDTRDFVYNNITPYDGDESFLVGPTEKTIKLWNIVKGLMRAEFKKGGVLDIDTNTVSRINSHKAGYIDRELETIVGIQTDAPFKRAIKPLGWARIVEKACIEKWYVMNASVVEIFHSFAKSHNDGVFDAYTDEMRTLRSVGILTWLPDNYARGRIIGDYARVALYGIDALISTKERDKQNLDGDMTDELIRIREEVSEQIRALELMKAMAMKYGFDISQPAQSAQEAFQWLYFGYLAALKEHDGAAMSIGNVSSFLDIFIERDMQSGKLDESGAQELVDHFIMKLRMVRHLRMSEYDKLFAGDPTWLTESIGGMFSDGKHKVTKTSYRFLHTLYNLGPSPEPNLTILWADKLPESFKKYVAKVSIDTSSIQYENDDLMRKISCSDYYGISCCVSLLKTGKQMQFFWARCNLAKALLMAINEGRDESSWILVVSGINKISDGPMNYDKILKEYKKVLVYLAGVYVKTMNVIHYMHDKYYYERAQMSLLDTEIERVMAFGAAGLSIVADSLSAIKYAHVTPVRNEQGITVDFLIEWDFPKYGNDDNRVDIIAQEIASFFNSELQKHTIYRNAQATLSLLTITSNVVYWSKTGATPDWRPAGAPFAPWANPMHGRDTHWAIASLNSVAKLSYYESRDGISNTFSIVPKSLGADIEEQKDNLVSLMSGYFSQDAHHLNVNVLNRDTLLDAMEHPENHPQLTIRVSGYAVNFIKLSREQQQEVIARTFHSGM